MGQELPDQRHLRFLSRYRLVRTPAGRLQAEPECEERYRRGGPGGDCGLLRYDPFRRYGRRDPARQDLAGVPEHRPGVRRHQCGYARDLQAAGLRSFSVRIL